MRRLLVCCSLLFLLAACEPVLRADVTRFYSLPPLSAGQSFAIAPEPGQAGDLEFAHYSVLMSNALQSKGFRLAPAPGTAADVVAVMHYGNVGSHTEIYTDRSPGWRPSGYTDWSPGWGRAGWGWRGYQPEISRYSLASYTLYAQSVDLQLYDGVAWRAGERRMLFQCRAVADSALYDLNNVMPYLVKALLQDFPGANGLTVRVAVSLDGNP